MIWLRLLFFRHILIVYDMEKLYKTNAVVLKKKNWREDDLLFSFFTEKYGKVDAVAVGARKLKSKLVGHLTSIGEIELLFVRGKVVNRITHAYLIKNWPIIYDKDLNFVSALFEIVEVSLPVEAPNKKLWLIFLWSLEELSSTVDVNKKKLVLNLFILKILMLIGYDLRTNRCIKCRKDIEKVRRFSFVGHGFVCQQCKGGEIAISQKNFTLIKSMQQQEDIRQLKIAPEDNNSLFVFLRRYLVYFLEKEIKSLNYLG